MDKKALKQYRSILEFEQLEFIEDNIKDKEENAEDKKNACIIKAIFMKHYFFYFNADNMNLKNLSVKHSSISCDDSEKSLNNAFTKVLNKGFLNLTNGITGRKTVYIHKNSNIPLIGTNIFGIIDRNTNCIEIKPLTGCNLNCIYCSVDEGRIGETSKTYDYVVEKDYLVQELRKLFELKNKTDKGLEVHIGPQGEPLLYSELASLIKDISTIEVVKRVSIDTNGLLLTKSLIDELIVSGLTRFNISLNSMDKDLCNRISNRNYDLSHLMDMIKYIDEKYATKKRCEIIIAPVLIPGINESYINDIIGFAKNLSGIKGGIKLGIQNFLNYQGGRNPAKQKSWPEFYSLLKILEDKYHTRLILNQDDFLIEKNLVLIKPFKKNDVINADIMCPGPYKNECIAATKGRCIVVHECDRQSGSIKVKIVRDKHNIFDGIIIR